MDEETKAAAAVDGIRALKMDLNVKVKSQLGAVHARYGCCSAIGLGRQWMPTDHGKAIADDLQVEEVAALMYEVQLLKQSPLARPRCSREE